MDPVHVKPWNGSYRLGFGRGGSGNDSRLHTKFGDYWSALSVNKLRYAFYVKGFRMPPNRSHHLAVWEADKRWNEQTWFNNNWALEQSQPLQTSVSTQLAFEQRCVALSGVLGGDVWVYWVGGDR